MSPANSGKNIRLIIQILIKIAREYCVSSPYSVKTGFFCRCCQQLSLVFNNMSIPRGMAKFSVIHMKPRIIFLELSHF